MGRKSTPPPMPVRSGATAPPAIGQGAQGPQTGIASAESKQAELAMMKSNPEKTVKPMQDRMPSTGPAALSTPKPLKKGGSVGSASRRADGIAQRGKTRGKLI